jgi:hypothetical protein
MGFEKVVLNKVTDVLKTDRQAGFYNGTLFVECNEPQARNIFHRLKKDYHGCVQISTVGNEYAFDFVVPADRPVKHEEEIYSPYLGAL